jgi:hypothetical protein
MPYGLGDLDVLSQAYHAALDALPLDGRDPEEAKAILMTGILDAARNGERDEKALMAAGLAAIESYEGDGLDAVMRQTPL